MTINHHKPSGSHPSGPYTPAVEVVQAEQILFVSGQGPIDLATGEKYLGEDIAKQIRLTLENLKAVIEGSGYEMQQVVKVTLFLVDMAHAPVVNEIYNEYFPTKQPARSALAAMGLPGGQAIEIEAIAVK